MSLKKMDKEMWYTYRMELKTMTLGILKALLEEEVLESLKDLFVHSSFFLVLCPLNSVLYSLFPSPFQFKLSNPSYTLIYDMLERFLKEAQSQVICFPSPRDHIFSLPDIQYLTSLFYTLNCFLVVAGRRDKPVPFLHVVKQQTSILPLHSEFALFFFPMYCYSLYCLFTVRQCLSRT